MKTLFILRHAEALSDTGRGDLARPLSDRGLTQARALGVAMKNKNYAPHIACCSPALRTQQTLETLNESAGIKTIALDKTIYHGTAGDLLQIAQNFDDLSGAAMLVGHNPVIHEFAVMLSNDAPADLSARLLRGYAPGTLAVFSCPCDAWADIRPGKNTLLDLMTAEIYCNPART